MQVFGRHVINPRPPELAALNNSYRTLGNTPNYVKYEKMEEILSREFT